MTLVWKHGWLQMLHAVSMGLSSHLGFVGDASGNASGDRDGGMSMRVTVKGVGNFVVVCVCVLAPSSLERLASQIESSRLVFSSLSRRLRRKSAAPMPNGVSLRLPLPPLSPTTSMLSRREMNACTYLFRTCLGSVVIDGMTNVASCASTPVDSAS